jgi:type I restriction enzyme S subunit
MSSEYQSVTIGDVCDVGDGAHSKVERVSKGIPYLTSKNIKQGTLDTSKVDYISEGYFIRLFTVRPGTVRRPESGDVLMGIIGTFGNFYQYKESDRFGVSSAVAILRPRQEVVCPEYLGVVCSSNLFKSFHQQVKSGSVQGYTNISTIKTLPIPLPPLPEQKAIAHILGTLDDKIELNRKTNETLEAMAKALFKSWFVDFDPVRAKAQGRPTGLAAEISGLFPDSFEDSELGDIPSEWKVDSIYSVASVTYGAPFSSSLFNGEGNGTPVARIRDLPGESPGVFTAEVHPKGTLIAPGDIVVGMDGEFRAYLWGGEECWMNQRVCKFIPSKKDRTCFLRETIRKPLMDVEVSETATTVIHLGKGDIDGFRVVVSTQEILDIFSASTTPLYEKVVANKQQTRVFANIRNALLPKLISGEIRIPDAEKMLEEVGI